MERSLLVFLQPLATLHGVKLSGGSDLSLRGKGEWVPGYLAIAGHSWRNLFLYSNTQRTEVDLHDWKEEGGDWERQVGISKDIKGTHSLKSTHERLWIPHLEISLESPQVPPNPQVLNSQLPQLCGWHLVHSPKRGAAGGSSSRQEVCSENRPGSVGRGEPANFFSSTTFWKQKNGLGVSLWCCKNKTEKLKNSATIGSKRSGKMYPHKGRQISIKSTKEQNIPSEGNQQ